MKTSMLDKIRDVDGNLVFDVILLDMKDLQAYALHLDMLLNRFDENSLDLSVCFYSLNVLCSFISQKVSELDFSIRSVHDFLAEDIPIDVLNSSDSVA